MARTKRTQRLNEADANESLERMMVESGERDRLREKLRRHLEDSGWREQVKMHIREVAADRGHGILMEDLVQEVAPRANEMVPDRARRDLAAAVQKFLERHANNE